MRRFFQIYTIASLCVCAASVSAQEKTPVALTSDDEELATSIATNPFSHNWELSVGLQGLSFFSNQETALDISKSPFASFRTNIGIAVSAAKWFTPQIALRSKLSGAWGRSVSTDDKNENAVNYMHLHEDVMVNLSNIVYAQRIMQLPINIFAYAIAMSIFPTMVEHFTKDDMDEYKKDLSLGIRNVTFIILPCAVGIISVRVPLVRAVYLQGNFEPENVPILATLLALYCIGMIGYSVRQVVLQGFYAVKETKTPVTINIFILCLNMLLTVTFVKFWGANGIAIAYSVAGLVSVATQTYFLRRKVGPIRGSEIRDSILKCLVSCVVMFIVVTAAIIIFEHSISVETKLNQFIELIAMIAIGGITYLMMALILKMEELTSILAIMKKKFLHR